MTDERTVVTPPGPAAARHGAPHRALWRRVRRDSAALVGLALLALVVGTAAVAPFIPNLSPLHTDISARLSPPSVAHPLGTDQLGRDILTRVLDGARVSVGVALGSAAVAAVAGVMIGLVAGAAGGLADEVLMRLMDLMLAFPAILLALIIVAVFGLSTTNLVVALGIVYIPRFSKVARASTLAIRTETYVEAARSLGAASGRLLWRHVFPNILSPLLIVVSTTLAGAVLAEASLSFLGLGVQPPYPSWGRMLNEGKGYLEIDAWLTVFPGAAVAVTVLSFNLIGDSLRDALDPRLRF
jgi:peptide/nickel transport system permease protein